MIAVLGRGLLGGVTCAVAIVLAVARRENRRDMTAQTLARHRADIEARR